MIDISLCMIVRNESEVIARCLDCVKDIADEIIIVDTGPTDHTKSIARRYTDKIVDFEWIDDFAAVRNFSFSQATKEYILWLDADDVLFPQDAAKLLELKETLNPAIDSVTMNYNLAMDVDGNVTESLKRNRLVKRANNFRWVGAVHEYLDVWGNIFNSDIAITHRSVKHDSSRNLNIYFKRLEKGENFSPRDLYYFANELHDHAMYERAIEFYEKFLQTKMGWIEDNIAACGKLADIYNKLGDQDKELTYIIKSFEYDTPRADFCCRFGFRYMQQADWEKAVFWYKIAADIGIPKSCWGPVNHACATWLPHLQLCVCYDRMGQHELAYEHNEKARRYVPRDSRVLYNEEYLENQLRKEVQS